MISAPVPRLTPLEWRILARLAQREKTVAIAAALGLAPKTVTNRLTIIYRQLGLADVAAKREAAARWYREYHVAQPAEA